MKTTQQIMDERFNIVIEQYNNQYKATAYIQNKEYWTEKGNTKTQALQLLRDSIDTLFLNKLYS